MPFQDLSTNSYTNNNRFYSRHSYLYWFSLPSFFIIFALLSRAFSFHILSLVPLQAFSAYGKTNNNNFSSHLYCVSLPSSLLFILSSHIPLAVIYFPWHPFKPSVIMVILTKIAFPLLYSYVPASFHTASRSFFPLTYSFPKSSSYLPHLYFLDPHLSHTLRSFACLVSRHSARGHPSPVFRSPPVVHVSPL